MEDPGAAGGGGGADYAFFSSSFLAADVELSFETRACFTAVEGGAPIPAPRGNLKRRLWCAAEHPPLALAHRHPLGVEVFHQRDGVLAADAQQILHVARPDVLPLPQMADDLVLDFSERLGMEVERLLDPNQPPV